MSDVERITALETWKDGHEERCTERFDRIASDTTDIKLALHTLGMDLKNGMERVHARIDDQISKHSDSKIWALKTGGWLALILLGYALSHWGPLK